jgi:hypothetical protein
LAEVILCCDLAELPAMRTRTKRSMHFMLENFGSVTKYIFVINNFTSGTIHKESLVFHNISLGNVAIAQEYVFILSVFKLLNFWFN